ncbi:MAG: hypothetical protein RR222_13795, partial [Pseudomonas sp.]|uniref:hypothetical protein n=1 Tax=Pseudomonas sp. TaxID=306 RepID=UPI002FC74959
LLKLIVAPWRLFLCSDSLREGCTQAVNRMQQRKVGATCFCAQVAPRRIFCSATAFCSFLKQKPRPTEEIAP